MKKTLIAVAALAAFGAASAQVTIGGGFGFAAQKDTKGIQGMAVPDGFLTFTGVDDLGGGTKVTAFLSQDLQGRGQGNPVATDASLTVAGGFGTVLLGSIESANGIYARGSAGAPISLVTQPNDGGSVLQGPTNTDIAKFTTASFGGVKFSVTHTEFTQTTGNLNPGLGNGGTKGPNNTGVGVAYDAGPISAGLDYTAYSKANSDTRLRASASYDLGVAKLGAGYESKKPVTGSTNTSYLVGVSAPVSAALTVGLVYAHNNQSSLSFQKSTFAAGADYALSKRTTLNLSAATFQKGKAAVQNSAEYRLRLLTTF